MLYFVPMLIGCRLWLAIRCCDQFGASGPHNFTTERINGANHVSISNGVLGRASHHGIHGHNNSYVRLHNLTIRDFEVAAISLNGGASLNIEQVRP